MTVLQRNVLEVCNHDSMDTMMLILKQRFLVHTVMVVISIIVITDTGQTNEPVLQIQLKTQVYDVIHQVDMLV
jgi:hypothetical protein